MAAAQVCNRHVHHSLNVQAWFVPSVFHGPIWPATTAFGRYGPSSIALCRIDLLSQHPRHPDTFAVSFHAVVPAISDLASTSPPLHRHLSGKISIQPPRCRSLWGELSIHVSISRPFLHLPSFEPVLGLPRRARSLIPRFAIRSTEKFVRCNPDGVEDGSWGESRGRSRPRDFPPPSQPRATTASSTWSTGARAGATSGRWRRIWQARKGQADV